ADVLRLSSPPPDQWFAYGPDPNQCGELRLPKSRGPHPVVMVIHGGCWRAEYNLTHITGFSAALARNGIAAWTFDYRRIGNPGGGWPGTFEDVARGAASLRIRENRFDLDLNRVVAVGHSAGGQLALWLAAHIRDARQSALLATKPIPLRAVVALAGITDLRLGREAGVCGDAITRLLGGAPEDVPERYRAASPLELLPLGVPLHLIHGAKDTVVPVTMSEDYVEAAQRLGDKAALTILPDAGHFEAIAPDSPASQKAIECIMSILRG
ncbi:MAG: alpha/beta hydrolase family protein, partial [Deltaproteobacteria bacterium]